MNLTFNQFARILPGLPGDRSSPSGNTSTSFQNTRSRLPGRSSATRDGRSKGAHAASLSSCWWKCWTFIWCAVLFLSRRNLVQEMPTLPAWPRSRRPLARFSAAMGHSALGASALSRSVTSTQQGAAGKARIWRRSFFRAATASLHRWRYLQKR